MRLKCYAVRMRPYPAMLYVQPADELLSQETYKTKHRGFSPQANYTDQATAACRRS
jgi:hypothetical protein